MKPPSGPTQIGTNDLSSDIDMPRFRVGLIVPATNTTAEPDFVRVLPDHVTVHAARIWLPETSVTAEGLDRMNGEVELAAKHLAEAGVDVVVYASTAGSFYRGGEFENALGTQMESIAGVPAVITATAVTDALRSLEINKVTVATPYNEWENEKLRTFLQESGFFVVSIHGDPAGAPHGGRGHSDLSPESAFMFSRDAWDERAEGMLCACTAWRTLEIVARLEAAVDQPVVTANQALIWALSKKFSIRLSRGHGRLLDELVPPADQQQ